MRLLRGAQVALSLSLLLSCGVNCAAQAEQFRPADVQAAIKGLSSEDQWDRKSAGYHLSEMGPIAKDAVPNLILVLQTTRVEAFRRFHCCFVEGRAIPTESSSGSLQ